MEVLKMGTRCTVFALIIFSITACSGATSATPVAVNGQTGMDYLKELRGKWIVEGDKEGPFGWEFDVTSGGSVVVERLKVGTPTEMTTTYYLDHNKLYASHYCQLKNQPHLTAVTMEEKGDLHFLCDGNVGNARSHSELHMHAVHFQKKNDGILVWMDMFENNRVAFKTSYKLVRAGPRRDEINSGL